MSKELKIGDWYYRIMGYGGGDSRYCCIRRNTGKKTSGNVYSICRKEGMGMFRLPSTDIFEAVDECGRTFEVTANDLAANGHIGIGTLDEPKCNGHVAWLYREDARLLVEMGKYTAEEITAVFPMALTEYGDAEYEKYIEEHSKEFTPMTDKQEEILKAAYAANCEKEKKEAEESARKYAAEVAALREKYNYIPCPKTEGKWLTVGEKRRNVLAVLKHEFPGVKFKAHTRNGSTSDSIRVEYEDGPAYDKVKKVLNAFETTTYNAYEDIHEDCTQPAACVCGGFDYVFLNRSIAESTRKFVEDSLSSSVSGIDWQYVRSETSRILGKTDFPLGGYEVVAVEYDGHCGHNLVVKAKAEPSKPTPPDAPKGDGVMVTENAEKNGIEIRFPAMPSEAIRNFMKTNGWRWTRFNGGCWYNRATDENRKVAAEVAAMWEEENGKAAA